VIKLSSLMDAYIENQTELDHPNEIRFGSAAWSEFRAGMLSLYVGMPPAKRLGGFTSARFNDATACEDVLMKPDSILVRLVSGKERLYHLAEDGGVSA
jgi:hypothetical protein